MTHSTNSNTPRSTVWAHVFLDHPHAVNESYWQHLRFALWIAFWLGLAALAALVHAVIPVLCETTASRILCRLHTKIQARGSR